MRVAACVYRNERSSTQCRVQIGSARDGHRPTSSPEDAHEYGRPVWIHGCPVISPDSAYEGTISTRMCGARRCNDRKVHDMGGFVKQHIDHRIESPTVNRHREI